MNLDDVVKRFVNLDDVAVVLSTCSLTPPAVSLAVRGKEDIEFSELYIETVAVYYILYMLNI